MTPAAMRCGRERGAALVVALFMLIAILLLGASAAQQALQGEKAARTERDRDVAFQAAEEALMDAENDIDDESGTPRSALFEPASASGFADGCGAGLASASLGLCARAVDDAAPVWQSIDLADSAAASARSVPYGKFTGASMPTGEGFLPFKRPRYIIERLPYSDSAAPAQSNDATEALRDMPKEGAKQAQEEPAQEPAAGTAGEAPEKATEQAGPAQHYFYRVTAIGFGARETSQVVLQSYYRRQRKVAGAGGTVLSEPGERLSWREVPNWRELYDAAHK